MKFGILAITLLSQCSASAAYAESSRLIRLSERTDLFGWEAVGKLEIGKNSYCTGVLIETDLVLTAAHCIYDRQTGLPYPVEKFTFKAGLRDGKAIEVRGAIKTAAPPAYHPQAGVTRDNIRYDVALIRLDEPISSFTAAPFKLHTGKPQRGLVSVVSYGQGRDDALSWQRKCEVLGQRSGLMAFNCNVTFGSSGAPVFVKQGGRARILSLVSSGSRRNGKAVSWGMELPATVSWLKQELRRKPAQAKTKHRITFKRLTLGNKNKTGAKFIRN